MAGPIAAFLLCWGRVHELALTVAVLVPTPGMLALLSLRGRSNWAAQDAIGWIDREAAERWRDLAGNPMPRNSIQAAAWLDGHPDRDLPAGLQASALLMAGRIGEARQAIASLPAESPADLHQREDFRLAADAAEGLPVDVTAADETLKNDPASEPAARAVHLGYHAAIAAESRGIDGLPALAAARPALGRLPAALALRLWVIRFRNAVVSALFGAWLLAAILVGLATSGGVVWF